MQSKKKGIGYGHTQSKSELKTLLHDIWRAQKIKADRHETCSERKCKEKTFIPHFPKFFNYLQRFSTVLLYFIFLVSNISCYTLRQNRVFCHFNEKSIPNSIFFNVHFFSDVNFFLIYKVYFWTQKWILHQCVIKCEQ